MSGRRVHATVKLVAELSKPVWVRCAECARDTQHDVLTKVEQHDQSDDGDIQVWDTFEVIRCRGCVRVSFMATSQNTEDTEFDPIKGQVTRVERKLYPDSERTRVQAIEPWSLPEDVRRPYRETLAGAAADLKVIAGIGLRLIVESVCRERACVGNNLERKIDALIPMGLLSKSDAELLHSTRLLGNDAAHNGTALTDAALDAALGVVEHLLRTVYVLPNAAAALPKRKVFAAPPPGAAVAAKMTKAKPVPKARTRAAIPPKAVLPPKAP